MRVSTQLALAAALLGFTAGTASASTLYANIYNTANGLHTLDQSTGAATLIGGDGDNIGDLTSYGSTLYGVRLIGGNELITIDPTTGNTLTAIAITGTRAGLITSIAINPLDGKLYGNTTPGFGDNGGVGDRLYEIDRLTGVATLVGAVGFENTFGLGFTQSGVLYGISDDTNELIQIDTGTGIGTLVGGTGLGFMFDIASRPEDDVMYALDSGTFSLYTIDLATALVTLVGAYGTGANLAGLAFLTDEVPEPAALALFGLGLAGLASARRRRKA